MAKTKTEIHVTTVFDGELDAADVFVSLIAQKYGQNTGKENLAKTQDLGYTDGGAPFGVMWEEVGIDPGLPFEEKVKLYHMQMLGL